MSLFERLHRRRHDLVEATLVAEDEDGDLWAKPLPYRWSAVERFFIPRRLFRDLDLTVGECVVLKVDPIGLRTRGVRRLFPRRVPR
jgi:hypothetical protein